MSFFGSLLNRWGNSSLRQTLDGVEFDLSERDKDLDHVRGELSAALADLDQARGELKDSDDEIDHLETRVEELEIELRKAKATIQVQEVERKLLVQVVTRNHERVVRESAVAIRGTAEAKHAAGESLASLSGE